MNTKSMVTAAMAFSATAAFAEPDRAVTVTLGGDERHAASMWIAKAIWSDLGEEV